MLSGAPIEIEAAALAEAKAYLRVVGQGEDPLLERVIGAGVELCERFTGLALVVRTFEERLRPSGAWTRLGARPVRAITTVERLNPDGSGETLPSDDYALDIDAAGEGWVRITGVASGLVRVTYEAGMAEEWDGLPEALRQGVIRLAAHLYAHREAEEGAGPPAAVTALWRPYRRLRLA